MLVLFTLLLSPPTILFNIEEWDYYFQRFENELAVHGLLNQTCQVANNTRRENMQPTHPQTKFY